jgi:trypsin
LALVVVHGWTLARATGFITSWPDGTVVISSTTRARRSAQCLGVLVAPATVLASSACLDHEFDQFAAAFSPSLTVQSSPSDKPIAVADVSSSSSPSAGSFALLELSRPMFTTTPALLQTIATGFHAAAADVSLHVDLLQRDTVFSSPSSELLELSACAPQLERLQNSQKNQSTADTTDWLCIDTGTPSVDTHGNATATNRWIRDGFLLGQDTRAKRSILWGLVWMSATHTDHETVGMPTSTLVRTVHSIRDFLARRAVGYAWAKSPATKQPRAPSMVFRPSSTEKQTGPTAEASRSGSADYDKDQQPDTVGDCSHGCNGTGEEKTEEPPSPLANVPLYLYDFAGSAAVLTASRDPATNATLAYFVGPRHLVLPRTWLHETNVSTLQWATVLSGGQSRVKKVTLETEFYAGKLELLAAVRGVQLDLVVVEIEDPVDDVLVSPVVAELPEPNVEYWHVTTKLVDRALKSQEGDDAEDTVYMSGPIRFVETQQCGLMSTETDSEFLCGKMTQPSTPPYPPPGGHHVPSVVGVMELDGAVVGFTLESPRDPLEFTVLRLASPIHRAFLDAVITKGITWQLDDAFAADARETATFPAYQANLYTVDKVGDEFYACTGLLVAPQFVLTTASCLRRVGAFSSVGFQRSPWDSEQFIAVRNDYQIPHPLYKTHASDFLVDVAVLGLAQAVLGIAPIALNPGYPAWLQNATIGGLASARRAGGQAASAVEVCDAEAFGSRRNNTTKGSGTTRSFRPRGLCMKRSTPTSSEKSFSIRRHEPLITTTSFGATTASGFSVASAGASDSDSQDGSNQYQQYGTMSADGTTPGSSGVQVFMSFADNANFINGHVRGVTWGKEPATAFTPSSLASAPAYVVGLRITRDGPNFCSGTLVASGYVLTAAHCVSDALVKFVEVSGGASGPEVLPVVTTSIRVHDSYGSPHPFSYDAAILELAVPASAYGVTLDLSTDYASSTRATMFGFGVRSSADLDKPLAVHAITGMPIYTRAQCAATLPEIDGSMLCAGGEKGKDACQGDSGGPLVLRTSSSQEFLVGIVSAGYGCGLEGVPGVYARASSLVSFVQSYVAGGRFAVSSGTTTTPSVSPTVSPTPSPSNETRSGVDPTTIESYSGNNSSSHGSTTTTTSTSVGHTPSPALGSEFDSPLRSTTIAKDLQASVRAAFMSFLMGDWYTYVEDPVSPLKPLMEPTNQLTLLSRGDATGLATTLRRHESNPLYARKDRFGRGTSVQGLWEGDIAASSKNVCAAGSH